MLEDVPAPARGVQAFDQLHGGPFRSGLVQAMLTRDPPARRAPLVFTAMRGYARRSWWPRKEGQPMSASAATARFSRGRAYPPQPITISVIAAAALGLVGCFFVYGLATTTSPTSDRAARLGLRAVHRCRSRVVAAPGEPPRSAHARRRVRLCALGASSSPSTISRTRSARASTSSRGVFLHVYLAFPEGRLQSWFERALVVAAYVSAIGLQLLNWQFPSSGPTTSWRFRSGRTSPRSSRGRNSSRWPHSV